MFNLAKILLVCNNISDIEDSFHIKYFLNLSNSTKKLYLVIMGVNKHLVCTAGIFDLHIDINLQSLLIFTGFGKALNSSVKEGMKATEFSISNPLGIPIPSIFFNPFEHSSRMINPKSGTTQIYKGHCSAEFFISMENTAKKLTARGCGFLT